MLCYQQVFLCCPFLVTRSPEQQAVPAPALGWESPPWSRNSSAVLPICACSLLHTSWLSPLSGMHRVGFLGCPGCSHPAQLFCDSPAPEQVAQECLTLRCPCEAEISILSPHRLWVPGFPEVPLQPQAQPRFLSPCALNDCNEECASFRFRAAPAAPGAAQGSAEPPPVPGSPAWAGGSSQPGASLQHGQSRTGSSQGQEPAGHSPLARDQPLSLKEQTGLEGRRRLKRNPRLPSCHTDPVPATGLLCGWAGSCCGQ